MKSEQKLYTVGYDDSIIRTEEKIFVTISHHYNLEEAMKAWQETGAKYIDADVKLKLVTTTTVTLMCRKGHKTSAEQVKLGDVKGVVTTVTVNDQPYYVYEYDNGAFIDTVIRGPGGQKIDEQHPNWRAVGLAYIDSTPED